MREFKSLMPFHKALDLALESSIPTEKTEEVDLESALGRILAKEVTSPMNVPGYTRAAMDGYALNSDDTSAASEESKLSLRITGEIFAGDTSKIVVTTGESVKIATGGMLPEGADAVIPFEKVEEQAGSIILNKPVERGASLGLAGEDIKKGEVVLNEGIILHSAHLGAAASIGIGTLECYRKPEVAIAVSGDEIAEVGKELGEGQVYDTNSYTLSAIVEKGGGESVKLPIVRDSVESIENSINSSDADIIAFTGGSSVGERDLIVDAVRNLGEVIFHGITVKPGKPTLLGRVNGKLILGMPGYPTSCLTVAAVILAPMLRKISRIDGELHSTTIEAELGETLTSKKELHQIVTVRIDKGTAIPVFKSSSVITSMSKADGYVELPYGITEIRQGEKVKVTLL